MSAQEDQPPGGHNYQYSEDSACVQCGGIVRCETWCNTESSNVRYAHHVLLYPNHLSLGDQLILHALGVTWTAESIQLKLLSN